MLCGVRQYRRGCVVPICALPSREFTSEARSREQMERREAGMTCSETGSRRSQALREPRAIAGEGEAMGRSQI